MSFIFQWGPFSPEFIEKTKVVIQDALNKGSKPAAIADTIYVNQLNIGTKVHLSSCFHPSASCCCCCCCGYRRNSILGWHWISLQFG